MSQSFLNKLLKKPATFKPWMALLLPIWVAGGFFLSQYAGEMLFVGLHALGVDFGAINETTLQTVFAALVYVIAIIVVIAVPWWIRHIRTTRAELGVAKPLTWMDLLIAPAGFIVYIFLSSILTTIASHLPFYNADQVQNTGFSQLSHGSEFVLAFVTLVVIAPLCEEILFRGYLLGKLRKYVPVWAAVLVTSVLFGIVHLAWNVGVDVFALSLVLCTLRITTGRLWPSVLLHAIKNGIAFYYLFINPLM